MFMICKSMVKKGDRIRVKVIRPPYHLDRIIVKQLRETGITVDVFWIFLITSDKKFVCFVVSSWVCFFVPQ